MTRHPNENTRVIRFGDFVVAAYQAWGWRRANRIVRRAVNTHLIEFRGGQRVVITEA